MFAQQADMKVMTFNIRCGMCDDNTRNNWNDRKPLVADVIGQYKPDLIGFQELIPAQRGYISSQFPQYGYFGVGREQDGGGEGCAIFYNTSRFDLDSTNSGTFWFSTTPDVPGSSDMGDIFSRICTYVHFKDKTTGKYFYHCNTHITYIDSLQEKYLDFMISELGKRLKHDDPILITGDFNADEHLPVMSKFKNFGGKFRLSDTYRMVHPDGSAGTFHGFTGKDDGKKIDFIFVQENKFGTKYSEIIKYTKNKLYPTDHFVLVSDIFME
jgi:endonuclease/exonuclease/phosphatase family metal-dependent hydrolase